MKKLDNKVEPLSYISEPIADKDIRSSKHQAFAHENRISQPTSDQLNFFTYENIRPSSQQALAQESQITQENGISFLHYFSWLSDLFLSIGSMGVWAIIPVHNMLEEPLYW